jgi:hypothetical protein
MARMRLKFVSLPVLLLSVGFPAFGASPADSGRISFLEQEVRNLQRQILVLNRQVDELRNRPGHIAPTGKPASGPTPENPSQWLDAAKWKQLRNGMSELEVVSTLGPPTSMREENGARVLYYALEIGASGFLGGSVTMRDRVIVEVRQPTLQ